MRALRSKDPIVERLGELGISLPEAPQPLGAYLPVVESGSTLYVSMQGPLKDGKSPWSGLLGREVSIEQGRDAARQCVLNSLVQIQRREGGFQRIAGIARLDGYIACIEDFFAHPAVLDGASDLIASLFGSRAGHARSVCGVRNLPGNVPVALMLTITLRSRAARVRDQ